MIFAHAELEAKPGHESAGVFSTLNFGNSTTALNM
jgi:hypothetical protein